MSLGIKKGDIVEVISGNQKYDPTEKKRGKVVKVLRQEERVLIENINKRYKHLKPSQANPKGGRIEKEMPLHISNVMLVCPSCSKTTRIKTRLKDDGSKMRFCMRCDAEIASKADN